MAERPRRTIKFIRALIEPLEQDRCRATVEFERPGYDTCTATAEGGREQGDALRAVTRAAADALSQAMKSEAVTVRVRGVQVVEAFAQTVVIVSVAASHEGKTRLLLGVSDSGDSPPRAAALAVLNATNRFLGAG